MRRVLLMTAGVAALGLLAIQAPGEPVRACPESCGENVCRVPVFVWLEGGKIQVEPEVVHLYWGSGVVFEIEAEGKELVEIEFEKSPFARDHGPAWLGTRGPGKVKTGASYRPRDMRAPDAKLIGRQKEARRFKYSIKWSGGRADRPVALDPMIIIHDNGR